MQTKFLEVTFLKKEKEIIKTNLMVDQIKYMFHVAKSLEGGGNFFMIF